jgi:hypothetical protein
MAAVTRQDGEWTGEPVSYEPVRRTCDPVTVRTAEPCNRTAVGSRPRCTTIIGRLMPLTAA